MKAKFIVLIVLLLAFVFSLFCVIFQNKEGYDNISDNFNYINSLQKTHDVDLPINTTTTCENKCGPPNRCSITGEQCSSDLDCYGCLPPSKNVNLLSMGPPGYYDAGKTTDGQTPTYSVLTTDIATETATISDKPPVSYFQGVNTWKKSFDTGNALYQERYNPSIAFQQFVPRYPVRPTLSGEFLDNGPPAANTPL